MAPGCGRSAVKANGFNYLDSIHLDLIQVTHDWASLIAPLMARVDDIQSQPSSHYGRMSVLMEAFVGRIHRWIQRWIQRSTARIRQEHLERMSENLFLGRIRPAYQMM